MVGLTSTETKKISFEKDLRLEYKFARTIKSILGNQFIIKEVTADVKEATDFAIFNVKPFRVGARLRRYKYYQNPEYRDQFTIRYKRPSGVKTEIDKIRDGLVQYILYGFIDAGEKKIIQYFIGDLGVFLDSGIEPFEIHENDPHDSDFAVYRLCDFPNEFIVKLWCEKDKAA